MKKTTVAQGEGFIQVPEGPLALCIAISYTGNTGNRLTEGSWRPPISPTHPPGRVESTDLRGG